MSLNRIFFPAVVVLGFCANAGAQTNLQVFYDFGKERQYVTTTFEMFKADRWGDTFCFIDHYFASCKDAADKHLCSAVNGSYFEIERGLNFWQDSKFRDLSIHIEYDGSTWGAGIWCFGAKYFLHSADYKKTLSLALMYDLHCGLGKADIPVKFSGAWGINGLFGLNGLVFKGFIDVWGNDDSFSVLTEPQLWYNLALIGVSNLSLGGEIEFSVNFAGHKGFMCNPCLGVKWEF